MKNCFLVLANGRAFEGVRFGDDLNADGELVFTTTTSHMSTLTDPCFAGQIVLQTSPLIGNYGIIPSQMDSDCCHLSGYVVKEWCEFPVNFQSEGDVDAFLKSHRIAGVCGVDTRQITRILREEGTMRAAIADQVTPELIASLNQPAAPIALPATPPATHPAQCEKHGTFAFINCGAPHGIITALTMRGFDICEFPHTASLCDIQSSGAEAVIIGDGPGDPSTAPESLLSLIQALWDMPMLGIGFGHLLMARSASGAVYKLHHGHRGANQPIQRVSDAKVFISSLNQGYAAEVPSGATVIYRHLNDGSVAGLSYANGMSVQFVPDATLGPLKTDFIYDEFIASIGKVVG